MIRTIIGMGAAFALAAALGVQVLSRANETVQAGPAYAGRDETRAPSTRAVTAQGGLPGEIVLVHIRQEPNLCVPTAAAMVLDHYGDPQPPRLIKVRASGHSYDPGVQFTDYTITPFQDLIRGLASLGFRWSEETYPNTEEGFRRGIAAIESSVASDRPVLADVTLDRQTGHTFIITGFDKRAGLLSVVDPNEPSPGRRTLSYSRFKALWNETAYGGDFRALILTRPKGL